MKQNALFRTLLPVLATLLVCSTGLIAQISTGKMEGTVRDQDTGQPLQGAQVAVEGTRLGNVTNADGYYFILNVPPGRRGVTFTYTGYQKVTVADQLILAGQTVTINATLSSTVVELEGITIEGGAGALVPRDNTVTKSRLTAENLNETPVTVLEDMLILEAGVQTGGPDALSRGLRIRGGRIGQEAMVVDGVTVRNYTALAVRGTGSGSLDSEVGSFGQDTSPLEFSTDAVEEVDIITGGFQAEYGNAQSGIVNIVTKEGGPHLRGSVRFTTDEFNDRTADYGYNQLRANIGGPVSVIPNLFFHASGELQGQADRNPTHADEGFRGINQRFVDYLNESVANDPVLGLRDQPYTLEGFQTAREFYASKTGKSASLFSPSNPVRLPGNWGDRTLATGKFTYSPIAGLKLIVANYWSRNQYAYPVGRGGNGNYFRDGIYYKSDQSWAQSPYFRNSAATSLYIPQSYARRTRANNTFLGADWDFLRSSTKSGLLQFRYTRFRTNEITSSSQLTNWRRESTFMGWSARDLRFEVESYPNRDGMVTDEERSNYLPDGLFELKPNVLYETPLLMDRHKAYDIQYRYSREWQNNYKADIDLQWSRSNRAKMGVQVSDFSNNAFRIRQMTKRNELNEFNYRPKLYAVYMQNRTDLGDFVFDYGLRWDQFQPVDNWGITQGDPWGEDVSPNTFTELSPRFDVGFPVTDRAQLRFSYGVFTQIPSFNVLFNYNEFGRQRNPGNLGFSRTDAFETGISYLLSDDIVLDVVTYYRDVNGEVTNKTFFRDYFRWHKQERIRNWRQGFTNRDNGNIKGLDLKMQKRFSNNFSYNLMYTLQFSRTTGNSELAGGWYGNYDPSSNELFIPPDELRPSYGDQTHQFTALINYMFPDDFQAGTLLNPILKNSRLYAVYQLQSGVPIGGSVAGPNFYRGRWYTNLDLRISKNFRLAGRRSIAVFAEVFNALNRKTQANYPRGTQLEEYLHGITGGLDLTWDQLAESDFNRVRFNSDFNGDGVLTVEEAGLGQIAYDAMMNTMDKRAWGIARQIRMGLNLSF